MGSNRPTPELTLKLQCLGNPNSKPFIIKTIPDTGTTRTLMSFDIAQTYGIIIDRSERRKIRAANGSLMDCQGHANLAATLQGKNRDTVFLNPLVSKDIKNEILISWHDLMELKVIPSGFPNQRCLQIQTCGTYDQVLRWISSSSRYLPLHHSN